MTTRAAVHWCRVLMRGFAVQTRYLLSSGFFVLMSTVQPLVLATLAHYLFLAGGRADALLYAAIGAGMLNVWTTTLIGSGQALTLLRTAGLLELLVAAPVPFPLVLAPMTVATATVGMYALGATLAWGWLVFDIPLQVAHPWLLAAALPATVLGLGMLGMVLASLFVRFRYANALTNLLDYPVWLLSGMLVPAELMPDWVRPVAWLLPTTWGVRAIRDAMLGGEPLMAVGVCLLLAAAYLGLGLLTIRVFAALARRRASLALS
jgi:ABC-2 type transport system permease protein